MMQLRSFLHQMLCLIILCFWKANSWFLIMDQHHPANKRVSICILHHGFKKWEWPGYHDGSSQWKETKWDGYSIPCEKMLAKTLPEAHNSCNHLHGKSQSHSPWFFLFCQWTAAHSRVRVEEHRQGIGQCFPQNVMLREGLHSPCFNGRLSVAMQGFGIIWGTRIEWCCTFWLYSCYIYL